AARPGSPGPSRSRTRWWRVASRAQRVTRGMDPGARGSEVRDRASTSKNAREHTRPRIFCSVMSGRVDDACQALEEGNGAETFTGLARPGGRHCRTLATNHPSDHREPFDPAEASERRRSDAPTRPPSTGRPG